MAAIAIKNDAETLSPYLGLTKWSPWSDKTNQPIYCDIMKAVPRIIVADNPNFIPFISSFLAARYAQIIVMELNRTIIVE
jgi:hypothetical protein